MANMSLKMVHVSLKCRGKILRHTCYSFLRVFFLFIFAFSIQLTVNVQYKFVPMTGFELRPSGVESDRSTN